MHLKAISLRGFKSFVDPVEIRLEPGVAVVVGPNGSGKSNVSDSILWATGSMSPGELRAEKPDDVLFAGSSGRQPIDLCEVELLFDNADGAWPDLPYSEVSVSRRLQRGGEGLYLVNRAAVRRIDLVELLSDVGLGGGLRSVISQGRVETVLNSKPAERRELVEEAAGLGRFKRRRHRAELKLARVGIQVERARDLEDEVRKRLRPLALQATAAERAEKLGEEIARLQAAIATLDLGRLGERRTGADERRVAAAEARRALDAQIAELVAAREQAEVELTDAAGAREGTTAALYRLASSGERIGLRREAATALATGLRGELEAAQAHDPRASAELETLAREAAGAAQSAAAEAARAQLEAETEWALVAAGERRAKRELTAELDDVLGRRTEAEGLLTGTRRDSLLALRGAAQHLAVRQESTQRLLAELRVELRDAQSSSGPTPDELGWAADQADAAARAARREQEDVEARVGLARERLAALEQSLAEREGLPPAARALAEQGEQLALQRIEIEAGQERAVAAALGHLASAVLAPDAEQGLALVERARAAGLGSVRVLVGRDPRALAGLPVVGHEELLASSGPAVTADGLGWDPQRGELWFAGETAEAVLLELDTRRRELAAEVEELAAARTVRRSSRRPPRSARRKPPAPSHRSRTCGASGGHSRPSSSGSWQLRKGSTRRCASRPRRPGASRRRLPSRRGASPKISARSRPARSSFGTLPPATTSVRPRPSAAPTAGSRRPPRTVWRRSPARKSCRWWPRGALARPRRLQSARGWPRAGSRKRTAAARVARTGSCSSACSQGRNGSRLRSPSRSPGSTHRSARASRPRRPVPVSSARSCVGSEPRRSNCAAPLRRAGERLSAIDVELARIEAERDEAERRLAAAGAEPSEGDDRDELAEKLSRSERRRESLGQVNPLAKEEYESEKERLVELSEQRADLERSLAELERLRDDLTRTVETRFAETFEAVQRHFDEVAATLFPGGHGRLILTEPEEDGEEPGIEVELRPAGKKVQRLSLLSGGEKALGAIAFLFSLFLSRPSPSISSTRSRRLSTTRTSAASPSSCGASPTAPSSS